MKVNREETMRRMLDASEKAERQNKAGREVQKLNEIDDNGIVLLIGTYWNMNAHGRVLKKRLIRDLRAECQRRARVYLREMLERENIIAYEEE